MAIQTLGAYVRVENDTTIVRGTGNVSPGSDGIIDCGESGASLRFLTALAATSQRGIRLNASRGLSQRPHDPLLRSINELGASVAVRKTDQGSEFLVKGPLKGGETWIEGTVSSQFVSGLLFAAPLAKTDVTIHIIDRLESQPYVEMSVDLLRRHDIEIEQYEDGYFVKAPQEYKPASHNVPGDFSSAAVLASGAVIAGDKITITGLQCYRYEPDTTIVHLLDEIGTDVRWNEDAVTVEKDRLRAFKFDATNNPDLVPTLEVLGAFAEGDSEITGVSRLRYKETNRLDTIATELAKMGARIKVHSDRIEIRGASTLHGTTLDSQGDHRVAMACSTAAVASEGPSDLYRAESVSKSYPEFFNDLSNLGVQLDVE